MRGDLNWSDVVASHFIRVRLREKDEARLFEVLLDASFVKTSMQKLYAVGLDIVIGQNRSIEEVRAERFGEPNFLDGSFYVIGSKYGTEVVLGQVIHAIRVSFHEVVMND